MTPLSHNLEQCRGAGGDGVQFAGGVALDQYASNAVNAGAVCDGIKPALRNTNRVNLCETLFGQVLGGVGGNITADVFLCGFHGFGLLFWCFVMRDLHFLVYAFANIIITLFSVFVKLHRQQTYTKK